MNNQKTRLAMAMGMLLGGMALTAQAAMLQSGDVLTITAGVPVYDQYSNVSGISSGSWFGLDLDGGGGISGGEMAPIAPGADSGVRIGSTQAVGTIDTWAWGALPGNHYTTAAPDGGTTSGIDFSGWSIFWNGQPVNLNSRDAWAPTNCASLGCAGVNFVTDTAAFAWSGVYGDSYSLWFSIDTHPDFISGPIYLLHLEGTVLQSAVPLPAAAWLFGSGVIGLLGAARRRRTF